MVDKILGHVLRGEKYGLLRLPRGKLSRKSNVVRRKKARKGKSSRNSNQQYGISATDVIVAGTKAILSALPGATISVQVADFVFKAIGWSLCSPVVQQNRTFVIDDAAFIGLSGGFRMYPRMFGNRVPGFKQTDTVKLSGKSSHTVQTNYDYSFINRHFICKGLRDIEI
ncbi:hypothetical protein PGB90_004249 [Kerria lacca]